MAMKNLLSPTIKVNVGVFTLVDGMEIECFSSKEAHSDWAKVILSSQLEGKIEVKDMDAGNVLLAYDNDYDCLLAGNVRMKKADYWKEIIIRDDMIKLERTEVKGTFTQCTPQDIVTYILGLSGIENYVLCSEEYGSKETITVNTKNGINALTEIAELWNISCNFFFQNGVFYWGCVPEQKYIYLLEEDNTILSLQKYGTFWQVETFGIPWIHHSQKIGISHSKLEGTFEVAKTIIKSDDKGRVRMYLYFKEESNV